MVDRKQSKVTEKDRGTRCILQRHAPSDLLLPPRPHLLWFPSPPKNAIRLWIHQRINPITSQKAILWTLLTLGTKHSIHKPFEGNKSYPNHNNNYLKHQILSASSSEKHSPGNTNKKNLNVGRNSFKELIYL
jgi:hypothetical protein